MQSSIVSHVRFEIPAILRKGRWSTLIVRSKKTSLEFFGIFAACYGHTSRDLSRKYLLTLKGHILEYVVITLNFRVTAWLPGSTSTSFLVDIREVLWSHSRLSPCHTNAKHLLIPHAKLAPMRLNLAKASWYLAQIENEEVFDNDDLRRGFGLEIKKKI